MPEIEVKAIHPHPEAHSAFRDLVHEVQTAVHTCAGRLEDLALREGRTIVDDAADTVAHVARTAIEAMQGGAAPTQLFDIGAMFQDAGAGIGKVLGDIVR